MAEPQRPPKRDDPRIRLERVRANLARISYTLKGTADAYGREAELRKKQAEAR